MQEFKGQIVDINNRKIFKGVINVENGKIHSITPNEDVPNQFILPGFIDAHVHVESSMLIPSEFARLAVKQGTVATISDPHEIGNVLGRAGVEYMIANGNQTPFKFFFGAPSCVPATVFETAGATIDLEDIRALFKLPRVNYLAEMMNYPGVLFEDKEVMAKIELAKSLNKRVDGHAPGLRGEDAKKYIAAGIETDHECFTKEEAFDKLKHGMKILIREGSAAKNFEALYTLIDEFPNEIMLCSDDKHPNDFVRGHINKLVARAVAKGCDLYNVLSAACLNPIEHYNMDVGQMRVGDQADFCIVDDLENFEVKQTIIDGNIVFENGKVNFPSVAAELPNNFHCSPIALAQLKLNAESENVRVIVVEDGQLVTKEESIKLQSKDEELTPDLEKDVLKVVVVNRYHDAKPSVALIKNFGLKSGAIASCVAHDSHNIICVGTNDEDIQKAINLIVGEKGGVSLANGEESEVLGLPVAGIMTDKSGEEVAEKYEQLDQKAKDLGSTLTSPYMTLSFCALLVIPQLKLSDKGLFDGRKFEFVSLYK
ncbi:adenine deaminase [Brumimicrobium aurantiacum]|uniref:Adenine deaminase n=1 Tax=Brumimicrobium aurantiacum TaxID=1737063 RepID=A0A3E1EVY7_9FLAO|nr:adenine deaminase [Brumimicrobium aurantiacum]RFC53653.1 adenine deaminase [Brumimicrobium aurantiacum]